MQKNCFQRKHTYTSFASKRCVKNLEIYVLSKCLIHRMTGLLTIQRLEGKVNSVDPGAAAIGAASVGPPHLNLCCMQIQLFLFLTLKFHRVSIKVSLCVLLLQD